MDFFLSIQDKFNRTQIRNTYSLLKETECWPDSKLKEYSLLKLQRLILHAYNHVPYYTDLFNKNNIIPTKIKTFEDYQNIPILTKEIVKKETNRLLASNINVDSKRIKKGKTGGTTGSPILLYKDIQTRNFTWGAYYRWYDWMGINTGDAIVVLWGDPTVLKKSFKSRIKYKIRKRISNTLFISAFDLNDTTIPFHVENIIKHKPKLIRGYLSAILQIGNYLVQNQIKLKELKAISTTTETLLPHYREYIERAYEVPVYDQYGCGECGSVAFECPSHMGLHITEEHVHVEVLNGNDINVEGKSGRIILTDLDNYAMPFIRYENGDIGKMDIGGCDCGMSTKLLTSIDGRKADTIILKDNKAVHGVFFTDILYEMKNKDYEKFYRFQIYQEEAGKIEFRIEGKREYVSTAFFEELQANLKRYFIVAEIIFTDKLKHEANGKFKYIVSAIT